MKDAGRNILPPYGPPPGIPGIGRSISCFDLPSNSPCMLVTLLIVDDLMFPS